MEQEQLIERIVALETDNKHIKERIGKQDEKIDKTLEIVTDLKETIIKMDNKMDNFQFALDKTNEEIEKYKSATTFNIMSDVVKPVLISAFSAGGVATFILNFIK